jgi:aminopeptidase N
MDVMGRIAGIVGRLGWVIGIVLVLAEAARAGRPDPHSYGNPDQVRVTDIRLDLTADFDAKRLIGQATLTLDRIAGADPKAALVLDTRGLRIERVRAILGIVPQPTEIPYELGPADPVLGAPLTITLPGATSKVVIDYATIPEATALQWVAPSGTAGKQKPFLYTQSQSIHARTWIPCQDSPGVRVTYGATIGVKGAEGVKAVMSALGPKAIEGGRWSFEMPNAIPPYLIALAIGDLEYRPLGSRTGVWAEPSLVESAAKEFAETEKMLASAEKRFGPYRWGQYDILVLPPSFPFGGMENAKLTFVTPTVIAGDRSLTSLIAHELAHSWSGNLVTCATWNDFWLNEGFTTYLERRITEDVMGLEVADMERVLALRDLKAAMAGMPANDQTLRGHLDGRSPDDGISGVPYDKGAAFLERLEKAVGRERFDAFLKRYFDHFAFQSLTIDQFLAFLRSDLFADGPVPVDLETWVEKPGLPNDVVVTPSKRFDEVDALSKSWAQGRTTADELPWAAWSTPERIRFLQQMPDAVTVDSLAALDRAFEITSQANAEVAFEWLKRSIPVGYPPALEALESFLTTIGRMKYVAPLYKTLAATPAGRTHALELFARARAGYHPLTVAAVEEALGVSH